MKVRPEEVSYFNSAYLSNKHIDCLQGGYLLSLQVSII